LALELGGDTSGWLGKEEPLESDVVEAGEGAVWIQREDAAAEVVVVEGCAHFLGSWEMRQELLGVRGGVRDGRERWLILGVEVECVM
jgi:hypothetical protein